MTIERGYNVVQPAFMNPNFVNAPEYNQWKAYFASSTPTPTKTTESNTSIYLLGGAVVVLGVVVYMSSKSNSNYSAPPTTAYR